MPEIFSGFPSSVSSPSGSGSASTLGGAAATTGMGKEDFLKLLIAQLRNQDPMKPMEDREFVAQMAQFSALEATQNLSALIEHTSNLQIISQSGALVGKRVEAAYADGSKVAGNVSGVFIDTASGKVTPKLLVDGYEVDLSDVQLITDASSR